MSETPLAHYKKREDSQAISVAPFRGFLLFCTLPTAYAVGYFLSSLRDSIGKGSFYKIVAAR